MGDGEDTSRAKKCMDDSERLKALENLRNGAWQELDSLRKHEWKISLSIWASIAALIGSILIHPVVIPLKRLEWALIVVIACLIIFLHGGFILGVARDQKLSRLKERFFGFKMRSLISINYEDENEITKIENDIKETIAEINKARERRKCAGDLGPFFHWSTGFQFCFTIFLVIVAIGAAYLLQNHNEASRKVKAEGSLKIKSFPTYIQALPPANPAETRINSKLKGS